MSELRFTCPSCGQHMQCEKAYSGDKTTCPSCSAELRVPFSHTPPEANTLLPKAELILKPEDAVTSLAAGGTVKSANNDDSPFSRSDIPVEIEMPRSGKSEKETPAQASHALHCVCPVCQSELRVPAKAASHEPAPTAEVVKKDVPPPQAVPAETETASTAGNTESTAATERERQIAVAREAHQVSLYPAMKPRLSYILSGEQPGPASPNAPPDSDVAGPANIKTMNE